MRKLIGEVRLPNSILKYYIFGNSKKGFCVGVRETRVKMSCVRVGRHWKEAEVFAEKLCTGKVFPENVTELAEDYKFKNDSY